MSLEPFAAYAASVLPGPAALALVIAAGFGMSMPRVVPPLLAVLSVFLPERLSKRALDAIKVLRDK